MNISTRWFGAALCKHFRPALHSITYSLPYLLSCFCCLNWLTEMCPEGYVSRSGLQPCFPCPRGYFQPERGRSSCFLCPGGVRTHWPGATNISACEGVLNDAAASYLSSSVPTTQLVINDCFADPCLNNATCVSLNAGYTCECLPGWAGIKQSTVAS